MKNLFDFDGPIYRFSNLVYYAFVTNLLWLLFSLPIFTMGAATTAAYYVIGKAIRDEDVHVLKDFIKSFKLNFKQGTIIWLVLSVAIGIIYLNIKNIKLLGKIAAYLYPVQIVIAIQIIIVGIYIFPMLSRYEMSIKKLFTTSFFMAYRHLVTTICCVICIVAIGIALYKYIFISVGAYIYISYLMLQNIFNKYMNVEES